MSPRFKAEDLIPEIWGARLSGRLVPFIGAGLSRPRLHGWVGFLKQLNRLVGLEQDDSKDWSKLNGDQLNRIADRAALALRLIDEPKRRSIVNEALMDNGASPTPPQTEVLAAGFWPLWISTNYDD